MPSFLHVGCGPMSKAQTTRGFNTPDWGETRFDIDPAAKPDIVGTMTDMSAVASGSVEAIFSSHNIEHLYPHEVPVALAEFRRVLTPDGFAVITCPDIQQVCFMVVEGRLNETVYQSDLGPIAPIDILYGHRAAMAAGNLYMAHRTAFTLQTLNDTLWDAGFGQVFVSRRRTHLDLWAVAAKTKVGTAAMQALAAQHIPA